MNKTQETLNAKSVRLPKISFVLPAMSVLLGVALGYRLDKLNRRYAVLHEGTRQILGRLSKTNADLANKVSLDVDELTKKLEEKQKMVEQCATTLAGKDQEIKDLTNSVVEKQATILSLGKQLEASVNPEEAEAVARAIESLCDMRKTQEIQNLANQLEMKEQQRSRCAEENERLKQEKESLEAQVTALEEDAAIASEKIKHLASVKHICEKCSNIIANPSYGGGGGSGGDCDC